MVVLVLAAASAHVLAATDQPKRVAKNKLQPLRSSTALDQKQSPIDSRDDSQLPTRRPGAAKEMRIKLQRKRRTARRAAKTRNKGLQDERGQADGGRQELARSVEREMLRPSQSQKGSASKRARSRVNTAEEAQEYGELNNGRGRVTDRDAPEEEVAGSYESDSLGGSTAGPKGRPQSAPRGSGAGTKGTEGRGKMAPLTKRLVSKAIEPSSEDFAESEDLPQDPQEAAAAVNSRTAAQRRAEAGSAKSSRVGGMHASKANVARGGKRGSSEPLPHDGDPRDGGEDREAHGGHREIPSTERSYPRLDTLEEEIDDSLQSKEMHADGTQGTDESGLSAAKKESLRAAIDKLQDGEMGDGIWVLSAEEVRTQMLSPCDAGRMLVSVRCLTMQAHRA